MSSAASPKISLSPPPSADSPISRQSNLRAQVTFTTPTKSNNNHSTSGAPSPSSSLAFSAYSNPSSPLQSPSSALSDSDELNKHGRGRSSSLLSVHEVQDNYDDQLDQGVGPNLNVDWVDYKGMHKSPHSNQKHHRPHLTSLSCSGAWVIHLVLIFAGKILVDIIPGITQDVSWTTVNIAYDVVSDLHHVSLYHWNSVRIFRGSLRSIDDVGTNRHGCHYTPTKKWLTILPIALFLLCTHYTHLDLHPSLFTLNFTVTFCVALLPKLPVFHRLRFRFLDGVIGWSNAINDERSGPPTPIEEQMRRMPEPDFGYSSGLSPRAAATFIGRAPSPATKLG
ncbi:hypothetical protein PSHT_12410 [Puccinia striiformis]|uniref:Uncharacterized protein n=1 Tax=Puccinia striiformis TaxID=27350 RepID=A0A2S4UWL8_9BASI|nr:hypothetical protein PSHT_12410 [Puccinia striiformis]